jgi:multicomponent Na+:H+ antiporter subunit D
VTLLLVLIPIAAVILLNIGFSSLMKKMALGVGLLVCLIQMALVLFNGDINIATTLPFLNFEIDRLSLVMMLSGAIVTAVALIVGSSTTVDKRRAFNFVNVTLLCLAGMNGVILVRDIFSLYVFLEVTAVSSFILIASEKQKDAFEGSFKYLVMSAVATVMMLSSIGILLMYAGDTSFAAVRDAVQGSNSIYVITATAIFMAGLFIKAGLIPFHGWLPDAYSSAPSGVSVLLAGVVTKTTGIYTTIRIVSEIFGFNETLKTVLLVVGIISIFVGALAALAQKDMKRMLAYSSISQMGYIIIALGTGTELGIAGAIFHLFNHSIFKSQLFVNAAAVEKQTGTRDMNALSGVSNVMPVTGWTSVIAFLSTAGIPPLSGFWSKLIIVVALWKAGLHGYAAAAILGSLITLAYFLSMQRRVFFGKTKMSGVKEAGIGLVLPAILLAIVTLGIGIFFPFFVNTIIVPVSRLF